MSDLFDTLQERYQALVARQEKGETGEDFLEDVRAFIADAQRAGAAVADVGERSQMRAWMRFLANILYDATGVYPDTSLQPLARGQLIDSRLVRIKPAPLSPLIWAVIVVATGLLLMGGCWVAGRVMGVGPLAPTPTPSAIPPASPTPVPPTLMGSIEVGVRRTDTEGLALQARVFCTGTDRIMAQFAVPAPLPADAHWGWQLTRAGHIAAAQSALVWETGSTSRTVQVALPDGGLLAAGQYELTFLVHDQPVANRTFEVLAERPRVSNVQVSDVPKGTGRTEFEAGIRVIYVTYEYESLCPGLVVSHTLYHEGEGEPIRESMEWNGGSQGQMQVSLQAPRGLPFSPGDYEAAVAVAGEEQQRVKFTIWGHAFGDVTIGLGVQPDGTSLLTAPDNRFDWNTKVVYAIFDYVGMSDRLAWAAVWRRYGEEVARQGGLWDVEADGTEGRRWVVYYDERGRVLPGGSYSVTLYIENVAQRTADFSILYYVPPE